MKKKIFEITKKRIKYLFSGIMRKKAVIETMAGLIAIIVAITGFLSMSYGLFNHVKIKAEMHSLYGCTVFGNSNKCAEFNASEPEHMPEFVFDINNNNALPVYFDNESVVVNVLDYIPYNQLVITDEWGGAVTWIEPIEWNAHIDTESGSYVAVPSSTTEDLSDSVLKVDGNDYTKFKVLITPLEAGYYKIRIDVKYKYKGAYKSFSSDNYHLVCNAGFNDYEKRMDDGFNISSYFSSQPYFQNETLLDLPQDNIIWLPTSIKTYSSNGCLTEDYEWEYDSKGNLKKFKDNSCYKLIPNREKIIDCQDGLIQVIDDYEDSYLKLQETFTYDRRTEDEVFLSNSLALAPGDLYEGETSTKYEYDANTIRKIQKQGVWGPVITDKEYCFSEDNHLLYIKNLDPEANDLYRVVDYFYDDYGNCFVKDNKNRYVYNSNGQISEVSLPKDKDGHYTNRFFKYDKNGLIITEIVSSSTQKKIIDYTYTQFPENDITRRVLLFMQLLEIGKRPIF